MKKNRLDSKFVQLLKEGDMAGFDAIYNRYCRKLHGFVMMYLKQEEDAEEIVQEVFIKVWNARQKIDVYASFESFLFTIAYNSTMSLLRKRLTEAKSRDYLKAVQQIESGGSAIDELQYQELKAQLQALLKQLTPRQKEIFSLSRDEGLSHSEIAEKLNLSESTVNNHLVATLKFLKKHLGNNLSVSMLLFYCLVL